MVTIAVANQKGGVGKTTTAFNLSQILASRNGGRVLVIDNDPQGNLTSSFLEDPSKLNGNILDAYQDQPLKPQKISDNLDFLGSDITLSPVSEKDFQVVFALKEAVQKLQKESTQIYDYVIIDCLPSFGHLQLAALNAADYVLIPVKPAPYALFGLKDLFKTIEKVRKYFNPSLKVLGIVINQVDGRKLVMEREMEEALREKYNGLVFKTKISKRIKVEESPAFQKPITAYHPKDKSAKEFNAFAKEIIKRLEQMKFELPSFEGEKKR